MTRSAPSSPVLVDRIKRGRRTYGGVYLLPDGKEIYLAFRKIREIYRSGELSISDAVRKGTACWAIDDEHIGMMRRRGVNYVGVLVRDTRDVYLTHMSNYLDKDKFSFKNYESRGGSVQRFLPLSHFRRRAGKLRIK